MKKINNLLLQILLLVVSVLFFIIANPSIINDEGIGIFAFFVYIPVFILVRICSLKKCLIFGGLYGSFSYFLYAIWLKNFDVVCLIVACIYYFIICSFVFLLLKISDLLFKKNGWIVQWLCICSFEYLKTLGFLGFSYGLTAYTQWKNIYLIQIVNIIGVYGLNLFIIFISAAVSSLILKQIDLVNYNQKKYLESLKKDEKTNIQNHIENEKMLNQLSKKSTYILIYCWLFCLITFLIYGKCQKGNYKSYKTEKIVSIQSNESPWKNGIEEYTKSVQKLMELTDEAFELNPDIQIVVWPETAVVPAIIYNYEKKYDERKTKLIERLLEYIDSKNATFIIGNGHEVDSLKAIHDVYNSVLVFKSGENVFPPSPKIYSKIKLVPFTEYFPYNKYFPNFYRKLVNKNVHMWTPGREIKVFSKDKLFFSTPICFEDTFPQITRKMAKKGAKCFINLSNDSWSKSIVCQNQHLAMAVFRSVENKVPTIRSTTSGQTCCIMPDGVITKKCDSFTTSYVIGDVPVIPQYEKNSVYTIIGDIFGIIPVFVFLILLIIRGIFVIMKKSNK